MDFLFHFFHYYGYKADIFINKHEKYSNKFDNYLSIIVNVLLAALLIFYEESLRLRKEGTASVSIVKPNEARLIDLDSPNQFFVFGLENSQSNHYIDESVYQVVATYRKLKFDRTLQIDKEIDMPLVRCNETNKKYDYKLFKTLSLEDHYCFQDLTGISLIGDYGDEIWNYIRLTINKCVNSTDSKIICKSPEEIDATLKGGFFAIYLTDFDITPEDYYNPIAYSTKDYFTTISPNDYKEIDLFMKSVEMVTNDGLFTNNKRTDIYYNMETYKEATRGDMGEKVAKIGIRATTVMHVYTRTYKKLLPVLSEFWANSCLFITLIKCIFYYFERFLFKAFISSYFTIYNSSNLNSRSNISITNSFVIRRVIQPQSMMQRNSSPIKKPKRQTISYMKKPNEEKEIHASVKKLKTIQLNRRNPQLNETFQKILSENNGKLDSERKSHSTKNSSCCRLFWDWICCKYSSKNQIFNLCYKNIRMYLDLIRLLKLYNDIEVIKTECLDDKLLEFLSRTDKFMLNPMNMLNIAYK
ncbi:MAG: hypothetical protein MJ252_27735 [archaeon]|nr:hypothetical protein [archaeon]